MIFYSDTSFEKFSDDSTKLLSPIDGFDSIVAGKR